MTTTEDAWGLAATTVEALKGRVWLSESARDQGTAYPPLLPCYNWLTVQICDPKSRLYQQTSGQRDFAAYTRETWRAIKVWHALAKTPGFSPHENHAFWRRLLQEIVPTTLQDALEIHCDDRVFPRFRLVFYPRDCYDEDDDEETDAFDWIESFCETLLSAVEDDGDEVQIATSSEPMHSQLVLRTPMLRIHGPMGPTLQQHPHFLQRAAQLSAKLSSSIHGGSSWCRVTDCSVLPRGSMRPHEFVRVSMALDRSSVRLADVCIDLDDSDDVVEFVNAASKLSSVTFNVARADMAATEVIFALLRQSASSLRTLRLFNLFATGSTSDHQKLWSRLVSALVDSSVQELILERVQLNAGTFSAMDRELKPSTLACVTIKPLVSSSINTEAYINAVKCLGGSLRYLDLSTLCLSAQQVDQVLQPNPDLTSLRLGSISDVADSTLVRSLSSASSRLCSLSLSCDGPGVRAIASSLSHQSLDDVLASSHLKELAIRCHDSMETATSDALLTMLDTNHSLECVHLNMRELFHRADAVDPRFHLHHQRPLVRQLPSRHKLAFLSVLATDTVHPTLSRFDAGVASEILALAGHAVRRRVALRC
ncbi:hypothetical protein Poli38472_007498 [Pythium oligandrum]|uniref:Uncharacterized protein n=1 Tax=Pythium oligandrum TaxID=41045 RepID=A0A8K1CSG4_PYTOL|nr:hypothetical protein Poli38472_007498 [Pythium oligandrum]|eukprot:TMW67826.1 hypothetical protein Poli38472_007498 [Pythium oligandrum]